MSIRQRFTILVGLAALTTTAAFPASQPMIGEPAPQFDLPTVQGDRISLESLRGNFVVLHFGASW